MSTVAVTGASGFIGSRLIERLAADGHRVLAISRRAPANLPDGVVFVEADFANPEAGWDVREPIDCVVHLGGVTGDASEEDALAVNVLGTARLLRHVIDGGARRLVVASSIATVGCLTGDFMPRSLPIADDHPADTANVYGLSKYFVEELVRYFARQTPDLDATLFRIGVVLRDDAPVADVERIQSWWRPFCNLGSIAVTDVVDAFARAVAPSSEAPEVRVMNLVAATAYSSLPTAEALRLSLGDRANELDLSYFESPDHRFAGVYDIEQLTAFSGAPRVDVSRMTTHDQKDSA